MIVHIVMFKFKEVKRMLEALPQKITAILSMEVGVDFCKTERAMDLVLTSTFESMEGLQTYTVHPEHLEVVAVIKEVAEMSKVVDYVR